MKITEQFDQLVKSYDQMLKRCHDALDAKAPQAERDKLRDALAKHLANKAEPKPGDSSGGGE